MGLIPIRRAGPIVLAALVALVPAQALRAAEWALCTPAPIPPAPPADQSGYTIEADSAALRQNGISVAQGNVILRMPERTVTARRLSYDPATGIVDANGEFSSRERSFFAEGERFRADLMTREAILDKARYQHPESRARGEAERIEHHPTATVITDGTFTTCDPESETWRLEAKSVEFDHESGKATARHARFRLLGVPVLYAPWITFPFQGQRMSGFLPPSLGSSGNAGTTLALPYYLNLAPNLDAVAQPRFTSRRGALLGGELRYLVESGSGELVAEAIPEDRITGSGRSLLAARLRHRLAPRLHARAEFARVSDSFFLRDLGDEFEVAADTDYLERIAELAYEAQSWWMNGRLEDYQAIESPDGPGDPYRVVPRLAFASNLPERNRRVNFEFRSEAAFFRHRSDEVAVGRRIDLHPSVSFPIRSSSGHLVPRATWRYSDYGLDRTSPAVSRRASRSVPTLSLDGGLYFERDLAFGERPLTQTLEPRLYYVWTPYRDQDHLPLFEAGSLTPGYDHLFRENRFSGADRIGDENRLVLAFDTRILDGGRELLHGRIGQMRHLETRRVRFCTTANPVFREYECPEAVAPGDQPRSTWVAALKARPHRTFTLGTALEHDDGMAGDARVSVDLRFHPSSNQVFNIGYRRFPATTRSRFEVEEIVDETAEIVHASFNRELGPHLRIFGSANRALRESLFSSVYFGVEYRSCCWRLRLIGHRYLTDDNGPPEHESEIRLQWELRGLGSTEFKPEQSGVHTIPGYRNHF